MKAYIPLNIAVIAASLILAPGCMWSRVKVNDPGIVSRSYSLKEGRTKEKDLKTILKAEPSMRIPGKDSLMLGYSFSDTKHNGLMLILFNFSRSTTVAETLYVEIDQTTGTVRKVHRPDLPVVKWKFWPFSEK